MFILFILLENGHGGFLAMVEELLETRPTKSEARLAFCVDVGVKKSEGERTDKFKMHRVRVTHTTEDVQTSSASSIDKLHRRRDKVRGIHGYRTDNSRPFMS